MNFPYKTITHTVAETEHVGAELARTLLSEPSLPRFVAMYGDLGVGKTAFTRGFASHFGISGVKSPTYTIVNEYLGRVKIFHFDMWITLAECNQPNGLRKTFFFFFP